MHSGAENTIVTQRQVTDMLGVQYRKEFRIIGSDMRTELIAYLVQDVDFRMGPLALRKQQALVLEDDYFRFEEYTGTKIHGILGANISEVEEYQLSNSSLFSSALYFTMSSRMSSSFSASSFFNAVISFSLLSSFSS